jgi:hypothetical protein
MRLLSVLFNNNMGGAVKRRRSAAIYCRLMGLTVSQAVLLLAIAQGPAGPRVTVAGAVTVTNKGISLLPALTLGKPAAIFDVAIQGRALSFEPQLRWGLSGKPWSFIFWGRYRALRGDKLQLGLGAHPAVVFRTTSVATSGPPQPAIVATRYLAAEAYPSYALARDVRAGVYYLYSHGLDRDAVQNTHFLAARASVDAAISAGYAVRFAPQLYYLWMDRRDGVYVNGAWTLAHRRLPVAVSVMANRTMQSSIAAEAFLWNVSVIYALR